MILHPQRRGVGQTQAGFDALNIATTPSVDTSGISETITNVDTSAQNALQDIVNAMSPSQWAAFQNANTPGAAAAAATTTQPFQWGTLLIALGAFGLVVMIAPKKR